MYQGGKSRLAKKISEAILADTDKRDYYVEPFLGGASVAVKMVPHFALAHLSDGMPEVVMLWQAACGGWIPPTTVDREFYTAMRNAPSSALRGFVGFGCSFGGKWFGGYAKAEGRNYAAEASRSVVKYSETLANTEICFRDYREVDFGLATAVVYLDPPYEGTTPYAGCDPFDSREFWTIAERWASEGHRVYVSEFTRPSSDWTPVLEFERALGTSGVVSRGQTKRQVKEGLYRLGG